MKRSSYRIGQVLLVTIASLSGLYAYLLYMNTPLFINAKRDWYNNPEPSEILRAGVLAIALAMLLEIAGLYVTGRLLSQSCYEVSIGPFRWSRFDGEWKYQFKPKTTSSCVMLPTTGKDSLNRYSAKCLSGPVLVIIAGFALLYLSLTATHLSQEIRSALLWMTVMFQFMAAFDLLPFSIHGRRPTYGKMLWDCTGNPAVFAGVADYQFALRQWAYGARPRDFGIRTDPEALQRYTTFGNFIDLAYFQALDQQDAVLASRCIELMERHLDKMAPANLPTVHYELCYAGCALQDRAMAERYYHLAQDHLKGDSDMNGLRVKAYYAYHMERDAQKALELCRQSLAVAAQFSNKSQALVETDLVRALMANIG